MMRFRSALSVSAAAFAAGFALLSTAMPAAAQLIAPAGVSGSGTFTNSPGLIIDNVIPAEGSGFNAGTNVFWSSTTPQFTIDYGQVYTLQDLLLSLDNNDTYLIEISTNNVTFTTLVTVSSAVGEIGNGMDTFSTVLGNPEYIASIDFAPVQARYLRASATSGDNLYSIGEIQSFGTTVSAAAPEPVSLALLGLSGLPLFGAVMRRRRA
jgi:hypothetical protein